MPTQDGQSDQESKGGGWTVSDAAEPKAEPVTKTRRTSTSKPRTSSSGKTTKPKKDDEEKPTSRRKTSTSKHETEKTKPKSSESKRETTKTKPKSSTAKHKDGETASAAKKPKSTAKKPKSAKSTTSKRKTTKKESGKKTTRKRKEGLADLVGELLARRAAGDKGKDSVLGPILEHLTKNMGLSSDTAQAVVGYVLEKLQKSRQEKAAASAPGLGEAGAAPDQEFNLDGLLQQTRSGPAVEVVPVASGDQVEELARDVELDPATAEASLKQVLEMLGLPGL